MMILRKMKPILLTTGLALGLSFFVPANASAATYTAVSGDSLFKIGQVFSTTVENLMKDNNLQTTSLNIGQRLYVSCKTYTVQKGDTLFLIAQRYHIPLAALQRANNNYTDYLDIGQVLNIPTYLTSTLSVTSENTQTKEAVYSANDLDLLSRLITAEAQGEPYSAKVAVGAVVMNRVESSDWPNSIKEVIYQNIKGYYQFTPVVNGWINKPADSDSIRAAKEALSGVDPTNGAQFYYDEKTTNSWILAKPVSIKIGTMIFAY